MSEPLADVAQIMGCSEFDLIFIETIVRCSKTSFAAGMKILSPERRYSMYALYSFCRIVDDIVDEEGKVEVKQAQLQEWRKRIDRLYKGDADGSVEILLRAIIQRYELKKEDFLAIIDGMEMDIDPSTVIAPDEKTFDLYCDRVASAVGRLAVKIFGDASEAAEKVAYHLGRALQITNILRDLPEDAKRGRLYLPKELLQRFYMPLSPEACRHASLQAVCNIMAFRALDHFRQARQYMTMCDAKAIRPAKVMAITYRLLLMKQKRIGWNPVFQKASLSLGEKLIVGLTGLMV